MTPTKQIRIIDKNREAIEEALTEANGRLQRYLDFDDLARTAQQAESKLSHLEVRLADRPGAVAYTAERKSPWKAHAVTVAKASIIRRPSGWFLKEAGRGYSNGKEHTRVTIQEAQFNLWRMLDSFGVEMVKPPAADPLAEAA